MFKRTAVILSLIILSLLPIIAITTMAAPSKTTPYTPVSTPEGPPINRTPPTGAGIAIARNNDAKINTHHPMVLGPQICTAWGDPFSPISPTWPATSWLNPLDFTGVYTYQFRIRIPADYPDNVVRVELLDPDSMNQAENETQVIYSQVAQTLDPANFPANPVQMSCSSGYQKSTCAIPTGEKSLVDINNITIDHINPLWFMRMDENRGNGTNQCANLSGYTPETNTQTRFTLSYYRIGQTGSPEQFIMGRYTGQVGDNVRDNGDHDTDLRWVSPGAAISFDQATYVPSYGSFTVLLNEMPGISTDPVTGEKLLYLEVAALSGGSENGFSIWAGPDDYIHSVPSAVNERNLTLLNNPGNHDSYGVKVEAIGYLPLNSLTAKRRDYSLVELGPEYAGQTITATLFDSDAGTKPPVMYFMDTLAFTADDSAWDGIDHTLTDWGVSFGGDSDPLNRCFTDGSNYGAQCNNLWVDPVYTITLPSDQNCDYANPTEETCTPFYGGELQTSFKGGTGDSFAWHVSVPERPLFDYTQSCTAFPIAIDESIRSVSINTSAENQWRTDFDYPFPAPDYHSFVDHIPEVSLLGAKPGYVYNIQNGASSGGRGWLAWNVCSSSGHDLADSLTWPGNSNDYTPSGGLCSANGEVIDKFPGFMEVGDNSDKNMNTGDWVAISTGNINTNSVLDALETHIDFNRTLRVVVYDDASFSPAAYRIGRFALMRLIGYKMSGGDTFLMAEFIRWDVSCGQHPFLSINGPTTGPANTNHHFTATIFPFNTTTPIITTWAATEQQTITQTGGTSSSQSWQWDSSGLKTITVTAHNVNGSPITATHQITIESPADLTIGSLELVSTPTITAETSVMFRAIITNSGEKATTSPFFVDVYINPTEIDDDSIPIEQSSGYIGVASLDAQSSEIVTITAPLGFPPDVVTHSVYAMVDSLNQIVEPNEQNNISQPLTVTNILPLPPFIALTPTCSSTPTTTLTINGSYWPLDEDVSLYFDGNLRTLIANHDGSFSTSWLEQSIIIGQDYEITAVSSSHSASTTLTTPCQPARPYFVTISGPNVGRVGEPLTFVATVVPVTAVQPLTYTWYISETNQITHTNGLTDTLTFTWDTLGSQGFSLSVVNEYGFARTRFLFEIVEQQIFLPVIMKTEE